MKKLTPKEEEVMRHFWSRGEMFVRELMKLYAEPKPHTNTLSTMVRSLEAKGYLAHNSYGSTYKYYPTVTEKEFGQRTMTGAIREYMAGSYLSAVSALVKEEKISVDELRRLIEKIEKGE